MVVLAVKTYRSATALKNGPCIHQSYQRMFASSSSSSIIQSSLSPEDLRKNVMPLRDNIDMKNIALQAAGGRSSVSGIRATVFGASSMIGRNIVNQLGQIGSQVVLPYRGDGSEIKELKLMGDLGQIVPLPYQIRDKRSVERVIKDSNVVINCIQKTRETRNFSFHDTHVNIPHMIAKTAAELGVDRFIHISAANCKENSPSGFHRSKWHGEQVVKAYYPEATIIRPSIPYGHGDNFLSKMGAWITALLKKPKIVNGKQIISPCHFLDIARAVVRCILDPINTSGKTYSIYGNIKATKAQFWERSIETLANERIKWKAYRDFNPDVLAFFYRPIYPAQLKIQQFIDLFQGVPGLDLLNYEDILLTKVNYDEDEEDSNVLFLEDLGLHPEDYFYWETQILYAFCDYTRWNLNSIRSPKVESTYGGPTPTSWYLSMHAAALNGWRKVRKGGYSRDWHSPENLQVDWDLYEDPIHNKIRYGSNIQGQDFRNIDTSPDIKYFDLPYEFNRSIRHHNVPGSF